MLKLETQLFGGRGADSGYSGGTSTSGKSRGGSRFYDKTKKYKGMSKHEFENAIRDKKHEYIGVFDDNEKLIVAGTSYNKGSVAIPSNHPDFNKAKTLTHNHPYYDGRIIGGSLSGADVKAHLTYNLTETRAVSNGPNENTYIFRTKAGAKQNISKMAKLASKADSTYRAKAQKSLDAVNKKLSKNGKTLNGKSGQVYIGTMKRIWKDAKPERFGYEYVEVKKKRW